MNAGQPSQARTQLNRLLLPGGLETLFLVPTEAPPPVPTGLPYVTITPQQRTAEGGFADAAPPLHYQIDPQALHYVMEELICQGAIGVGLDPFSAFGATIADLPPVLQSA